MSNKENLKILASKAEVALEVFSFIYFEEFWNSSEFDKESMTSIYTAIAVLKEFIIPQLESDDSVQVIKQ